MPKAIDADCKRIQVTFPHYENEESDRIGLLTAIFNESITYDMPISIRESTLAALAK